MNEELKDHTTFRNGEAVRCGCNKIGEEVSGVGAKSCRKGPERHSRELHLCPVSNRETGNGCTHKREQLTVSR